MGVSQPDTRSLLDDLLAMLFHPRQAIRRIIDTSPNQFLPAILILASVSAILSDIRLGDLRQATQTLAPGLLALAVTGGIVLGIAFLLTLYFLLSATATLLGRWIGGSATFVEVRSAMAWGLAPVVAALLYRVPLLVVALSLGGSLDPPNLTIEDDTISWTGGLSRALPTPLLVVIAFLDLLTFGWYLWVTSRALGEAHRFSSWHGFATLILGIVSPFAALGLLAFVTWIYFQRIG